MTGSEPGRRQRRVSGLIRDELSRVFIQDIQRPHHCLITITRVEMPADLRSAMVYLTVLGSNEPERVLEAIRQRAGHFRKILASTINLKYNPELFFALDPVPEYEARIDDLIAQTKKTDEQGHD